MAGYVYGPVAWGADVSDTADGKIIKVDRLDQQNTCALLGDELRCPDEAGLIRPLMPRMFLPHKVASDASRSSRIF